MVLAQLVFGLSVWFMIGFAQMTVFKLVYTLLHSLICLDKPIEEVFSRERTLLYIVCWPLTVCLLLILGLFVLSNKYDKRG